MTTSRTADALIRDVRVVGASGAGPSVDMRITDGVVAEIGVGLRMTGEEIHDGYGHWVMPGLWDQHVHLGQWALGTTRLDTSGAPSSEDLLGLVRDAGAADPADSTLQGWGHRSAQWASPPTVAALDDVCAGRPVVLISGDGHHALASSSALRRLGLPPRDGVVEEAEWFDSYPRLAALPGVAEATEAAYHGAIDRAHALGVVGVVDLEFGQSPRDWARRAPDLPPLRVRVGVYDLADAGDLRTGDPIDASGLVSMGPLKIISDGSLNTRTAWCCEPYVDRPTRGVQNVPVGELVERMTSAREHGLEVALHAIGDAAVGDALTAYERSQATGSIEHAQLVTWDDVPRMARLGLRASVQPAHLVDDRDVTEQCWPDRAERCFAFRAMADAGVEVVLGSDAPVSPLDPWLAMAAAVHRSGDDRPPWHPDQSLTIAEAVWASTDARGPVAVGHPGDLILLDADPTALEGDSRDVADAVRALRPTATFVAGQLVCSR